jgi:CHAT domain-containing protein/tetratricopeptide (TPR) repeat protein
MARWFAVPLCGFALTLAVTPAMRADAGCGLDARNKSNIPQPVIGAGEMEAALEAQVRHGFELMYKDLNAVGAEREMLLVQQTAKTKQNVCAEALATWVTAQAARQIRVPDALPRYRRAAELFEQLNSPMALAHAHSLIALVEHTVGEQEASERDMAPVPAEFEKAGDIASSINVQTQILQTANVPDKAGVAERLWLKLQTTQAANAAMVGGFVQFQWAEMVRNDSKFQVAMEHYQKGLAILKECKCALGMQGGIGLGMSTLAGVMGDNEAAVEYALAADKIFANGHADGLRAMAQKPLGLAYLREKNYPKAIEALELSLRLAKEQHIGPLVTEVTRVLAVTYGEAGDAAKGLALLDENGAKDGTGEARCNYERAVSLLALRAKLYSRADAALEASDKYCEGLFAPDLHAGDQEVHASVAMAEGRYEVALKYLLATVDEFDALRSNVEPTDQRLQAFNATAALYYQELVETLYKLGRPEDALLATEQFRARAFVDLATSPHLTATPALTGTVELTNPQQGGAITMPGATRGGAHVGGSASVDLKSQPHPFAMSLVDLHRIVDEQHSTLVAFWQTDTKLYTWVLAPGKPVFVTERDLDFQKLEAMVAATLPGHSGGSRGADADSVEVATRGGEGQSVVAADSKPWRDLYDLLIAPIEAQLPTERGSLLTIVPQLSLFRLSFPALMDAHGKYLIERYAIHTTPSVRVLQVTADNERAALALPQHYLLVANPELFPQVGGHALPPLPGTAAEVRDISLTLGKRSVQRLEGRQAGIDTMEQALGSTTVLHFATHAIVNDDAPLTSFLALDRRQQGGMLTAASVYGLHMHTSLVVLSACGTGRGKISGDGVAGLSRAFFYAGAASLVTTLWDVVDEPTARLMPAFYKGLAKGESRSAALRDAQLGLIHDLRQHRVRVETLSGKSISLPETPAYWAGFSLSGQP